MHILANKKRVVHFGCIHTQERHHKTIRRYVVPMNDTTSLEKGLCESLIVKSLNDIRAEPVQDGLVDAHPAPRSMVDTMMGAFDCSPAVTTAIEARAVPMKFHRGGVAVYTFDGITSEVGKICFFAGTDEWGESAFIHAWRRMPGSPGIWRFAILDGLVRVPICSLRTTVVAHIGSATATILCPPLLNVS